MAALDFPPGTTVGQTFAAGNGVVYTWNGTLWLASGSSSGGDFMAKHNASAPVTTTRNTITWNTVVTGNSGGWYNTTTGRYTPPAGRYLIRASINAGSPSAAVTLDIYIRKNGTDVAVGGQVPALGNYYGDPEAEGIFDANGTDWFDVQIISNNNTAVTYANSGGFMAFPISGIKGPPGDPGQLGFRLLQRTDVSSPVADVSIQGISSDINSLRFEFDLTPATNAQDLVMQFYNNTGTLVAAVGAYAGSVAHTWHSITAAGAPASMGSSTVGTSNGMLLTYSATATRVSNSATIGGIRGSGTIPNIKTASRPKSVDFQSNYLDDAIVLWRVVTGSGVWGVSPTAITGFRLVFGSGNIASGAFSVWGSP